MAAPRPVSEKRPIPVSTSVATSRPKSRPRGWRRWLLVLAIAALTSALTYAVFDQYLSVLLPRGSWTGM